MLFNPFSTHSMIRYFDRQKFILFRFYHPTPHRAIYHGDEVVIEAYLDLLMNWLYLASKILQITCHIHIARTIYVIFHFGRQH